MSQALLTVFNTAKKQNRAVFIPFITAGYPNKGKKSISIFIITLIMIIKF